MNLTQKTKDTIDACRFCWMCRHICPLGNATGQERNTARARLLGLSLVLRDSETLENVIDNVYECALCGACTKECLTGWDPVAVMSEARLQAALDGVLPESISRLLKNIDTTENLYGILPGTGSELSKEIAALPKESSTLLFLGRDALCHNPKGGLDAIKLLRKAGVDFTILAEEPDSGFALHYLVGAAEETRSLMKSAVETLNEFQSIIVYDPFDAKMFLREYKEWNLGLKPEIKTWTAYLAGLLESGKIKVSRSNVEYTFQDPFSLARDIEDTDSARKILAACGRLREMLLHGKDTMLAGHLLMAEYLSKEIDLVARQRWADAENVSASVVVTASPSEYVCLKKTQPDGIELSSIEEVLLQCSSS